MDEYYVTPYGKTVNLMASRPVNYSHGGMIKWEKGQFNPLKNDLQHDNKKVYLEAGSLVIPRPVIPLLRQYLAKTGELTIPTIKDTSQLVQVIVMPEEYVVPRKYAKDVLAFLKSHGVTLPIPHDKLF